MTRGMKSGSGDDPFASDADSGSSTDSDSFERTKQSENGEGGSAGIPWYFRRQTVSDGRDAVKQLELREATVDELDSAVSDLSRLVGLSKRDKGFYTTDAREAILLAGMENLDDAAEKLRDWGYDQVEKGGGSDV